MYRMKFCMHQCKAPYIYSVCRTWLLHCRAATMHMHWYTCYFAVPHDWIQTSQFTMMARNERLLCIIIVIIWAPIRWMVAFNCTRQSLVFTQTEIAHLVRRSVVRLLAGLCENNKEQHRHSTYIVVNKIDVRRHTTVELQPYNISHYI